ncbi:type II secretion system protein M [Pseudomonas sp. ANT_H14]|uniref:type II secretion system protein GspM n=1 Tax=unclassified Pseudomonas TaxID=196821 RepID=UPI0011F0971B|nr:MULTISPECIES: type II secretion system protein GspM [unclassified Pseudomonas]KAA0942640.1 type II secretion system protein M [Pseudomonas sp. ANT_H4]KAA0948387.1 type II secretion system protein M [Pseudomonas sp. ANT_H14]
MSNPLIARWQHLRSHSEVFWSGLALREKRLLGGAVLVLSGLLIWLILIQPPLKKIDYWQAETPRLRAQAETLQVLLQGLAPAPGAGQDLDLALRQVLDSAGLQGRYQLESTAPGSWRLTFQDAPADAVVGWLLGSIRSFSLEVSEARLQRAGDTTENPSGTLSGTVRMDQALGAKEAS